MTVSVSSRLGGIAIRFGMRAVWNLVAAAMLWNSKMVSTLETYRHTGRVPLFLIADDRSCHRYRT